MIERILPAGAIGADGAAPGPFLGRQLAAELYGCPRALLADVRMVEAAMNDAARHCQATIVESVFHSFNPHGVSGAVIIAESHLAIHTWPEHGYAAVDVFTCGDSIDPAAAVAFLARALEATEQTATVLARGSLRQIAGPTGDRRP